jgi:hypothetical protein
MARHLWVLLVLSAAVVLYELLGLAGYYPPITSTVAGFPLGYMLGAAGFFFWLGAHLIIHWRRRRTRRGYPDDYDQTTRNW